MLQIDEVLLYRLQMKYKHSFVTSHGSVTQKDFFVIEVIDQDGNRGYGETEAFSTPWYTEETTATTKLMLENYLIPLLFQTELHHPNDVHSAFQSIRRNHMAKASLEGAVWDLYAKKLGKPLYQVLGGVKPVIPVGVSIGLKPTEQELLETIRIKRSQGYQRVKLKVQKGQEFQMLEKVRRAFPDLSLMIDANGAYTWEEKDRLLALDSFDLLMIEQPFAPGDFVDHAKLQALLHTPICLDESIHTINDLQTAIALKSCQIVNLKLSRVGGITAAKMMHDLAKVHDIELWGGGMLEAGIGRAQSLAIATLPQFTMPADTAGSSHYWYQDIIQPEITVQQGEIQLSDQPGIGYTIDYEALHKHQIETYRYTRHQYV